MKPTVTANGLQDLTGQPVRCLFDHEMGLYCVDHYAEAVWWHMGAGATEIEALEDAFQYFLNRVKEA